MTAYQRTSNTATAPTTTATTSATASATTSQIIRDTSTMYEDYITPRTYQNRKEEKASQRQRTRTVHRLVVYKRGPMLLMLVVDATYMSNQAVTDPEEEEEDDEKKKISTSNSSSKVLGDGVTSMPTFCRLLHSHAGKPLSQLTTMLEHGYVRASGTNSNNSNESKLSKKINNKKNNNGSKKNSKNDMNDYRFIYFNNVNLALKISMQNVREDGDSTTRTKKSSKKNNKDGKNNKNNDKESQLKENLNWPLSPSELCDAAAAELDHAILRTIDDVHANFANKSSETPDSSQDVMVKTASGGWLCARRSQHRELYVVLAEHLSALQASEALEALCLEFFSSVLC